MPQTNMKRLLILLLGLTLSVMPAKAQSWSDMLKGLFGGETTTTQTVEKPVYPTAKQIVGRWTYQQLDMDYTGDSALALMGVSTAKTQLSTIASVAKLTTGKDYVKLSSNGTYTAISGERKFEGSYSYNPSNGKLTLVVGDKLRIDASVTLVDGKGRIMFNAKQAAIAVEQYSESFKNNTTFKLMKEIVMAYPEITVGAIMKK